MKSSKCDVLITYCWNRVGYNILRSLTAKGLKVVVADVSKWNICTFSRFSLDSFTYPDPFTCEERFIQHLVAKVEQLKPKMLIPTHDESIVIAKHIDKFPKWLSIPISDHSTLANLSNKAVATSLAKKIGIPVPKVYSSIQEVSTYPVVFKTVIGNSAKGVFFPENEIELHHLVEKYTGIETLIQERIGGSDYSVDCIRMNGYFCASVYHALVTKTDGGGTTTQRKIVDFPGLIDYAKQILDYTDYYGVCGLDFRYDLKTNRIAFIEVNARYTGGVATPITAGFDIPYIQYSLATAGKYDQPVNLCIGVKTKWILGDIITLTGRVFAFKLTWRECKEVFRFNGFDAFDDFSKDDKKAIIGEFLYYFLKLLKSGKLNP